MYFYSMHRSLQSESHAFLFAVECLRSKNSLLKCHVCFPFRFQLSFSAVQIHFSALRSRSVRRIIRPIESQLILFHRSV